MNEYAPQSTIAATFSVDVYCDLGPPSWLSNLRAPLFHRLLINAPSSPTKVDRLHPAADAVPIMIGLGH
jgi:hypothetical protein